jgi:hypothetical protein
VAERSAGIGRKIGPAADAGHIDDQLETLIAPPGL